MTDRMFSDKEIKLLRSMLGKKLVYVQCDAFTFNNWVYQRVGLQLDGMKVELTNVISVQNYFGAEEDICDFSIGMVDEFRSGLEDTPQIQIPVDFHISRIQIVNETQSMNGVPKYRFVRGLVFIGANAREIAFEKTDDFSEQIAISRGKELAKKFESSKIEEGIKVIREDRFFDS